MRSEYHPTVLPTFTAAVGYKFPDTFVGVFLDAAWSYAFNNMKGCPSLLTEKEHILHVVPELRIFYLDRDNLRLYATLGLGARMRRFSETFEESTISNSDITFSYQVTPFGLSLGEHWSFCLDLGMGTSWYLGKIGCGYKF